MCCMKSANPMSVHKISLNGNVEYIFSAINIELWTLFSSATELFKSWLSSLIFCGIEFEFLLKYTC